MRGRLFPAAKMCLNIDTHLHANFGGNCFCRLKNAKMRSRESCLFGQSRSVCANFGRSEKCSAHELPAQVDDLLQATLVVETEKRPFRRGASQQSFDEGVKSFVRSGDGFLQTHIQLLAQDFKSFVWLVVLRHSAVSGGRRKEELRKKSPTKSW